MRKSIALPERDLWGTKNGDTKNGKKAARSLVVKRQSKTQALLACAFD
jgi:hypothetical protein